MPPTLRKELWARRIEIPVIERPDRLLHPRQPPLLHDGSRDRPAGGGAAGGDSSGRFGLSDRGRRRPIHRWEEFGDGGVEVGEDVARVELVGRSIDADGIRPGQ